MKLWLLWILASTVAFAVTASLILAGVLQWLMLRRLIADTGWWVPVSVGAVAIIAVLVFGLGLRERLQLAIT